LLFEQPKNQKQERSQAAKISRRLTLLHAHGLIAKVSHTYRWQVTPKGRRILTALLAARQADTDKLISLAA
jgi:DNA-binding HxlR family transcriptional regulator